MKLGRPLARCTSTVTAAARRPSRARLCTKDKLIVDYPPHSGACFCWCGKKNKNAPAKVQMAASYTMQPLNAMPEAVVDRQMTTCDLWHASCLELSSSTFSSGELSGTQDRPENRSGRPGCFRRRVCPDQGPGARLHAVVQRRRRHRLPLPRHLPVAPEAGPARRRRLLAQERLLRRHLGLHASSGSRTPAATPTPRSTCTAATSSGRRRRPGRRRAALPVPGPTWP